LQHAAGGAVDDIPPSFVQAVADRVGGGEIAIAPPDGAFVEKPLGFFLIRSSWL
jgi:hypothetical protein